MEQNQKPVIRVIEIPNDSLGMTEGRAVIEINRGQLVVEVIGFGSAEGKFKITGRDAGCMNGGMAANNMPAPHDDGWFNIGEYGVALVFVEPVTFGHIILNMYQNI